MDPEIVRQIEDHAERSRQRELAAIHARVETEGPALRARIERARQEELPDIRERLEADRAARETRLNGGPAGTQSAMEALEEARSYIGIASAALGVLAALHRRHRG
jgi:hypothetical protein